MARDAGRESSPGAETLPLEHALPNAARLDHPVSVEQYQLLERIGEGGMGEVWLAEQTSPVRRQVALKLIKAGMDTREVVARFESERQALALMDHPAIAKVFDAGCTAEGRPFFVMEYVPGVPLTAFCRRGQLRLESRLELFLLLCEGVQHAHQKAVIHRDLKPSNILASDVDGSHQLKIIDFGIAKAIGRRLTDTTLHTEAGSLLGTPEYMSPEQVEQSADSMDTRTDVYSLGVILYELLTDQLPIESGQLRSAGYEQMIRLIRETEPLRPSDRVAAQVGQTTPGGADTTLGEEMGRLRRRLKGDLDAITQKAIEKDRGRRYGSVPELAADLRHFLRNEPVLARAPSRTYRLAKYVRRHRLMVVMVLLMVLSLATFSATLLVQLQRVAEERDRANAWISYVRSLFDSSDRTQPGGKRPRPRSLAEEEAVLRDTLRILPEGMLVIRAREDLAENLTKQGRFDEAGDLQRANVTTARALRLPYSVGRRASLKLAAARVAAGKKDEALSILEEVTRRPNTFDSFNLEHNLDFAALTDDPRFRAIIDDLKARGF